MKAKKLLHLLPLLIGMAITLPAFSSSIVKYPTEITNPVKEADIKTQQLLARLKEIKDMDKSGLSRLEKKELRKEVSEMKKSVKGNNQGVYLSVGAIIIIILLLILIL
jgi:hypothetical protein